MHKQMSIMGVLTLSLCILFLYDIDTTTDPEGVALFGGLGSLILLIASPFWILCRRTTPLWFAFTCGLAVVSVAVYGGGWSDLLSGEALPDHPSIATVIAAILAHPQDCWLGLVYCTVLTILAAFQKRGQRLKTAQAQRP
jgi:hypothetical protein